jgi:hypothetical protein
LAKGGLRSRGLARRQNKEKKKKKKRKKRKKNMFRVTLFRVMGTHREKDIENMGR